MSSFNIKCFHILAPTLKMSSLTENLVHQKLISYYGILPKDCIINPQNTLFFQEKFKASNLSLNFYLEK